MMQSMPRTIPTISVLLLFRGEATHVTRERLGGLGPSLVEGARLANP
jgi:hypothetical protein